MSENLPDEHDVEAIEVSHQEFCSGLPAGRFRLIVNPDKARRYVRHRLLLVAFMLPLIGIGAALALSGYTWSGLILVAAGVLLHRLTGSHAAKILLHLATQDERIYREALELEILEVRLAR